MTLLKFSGCLCIVFAIPVFIIDWVRLFVRVPFPPPYGIGVLLLTIGAIALTLDRLST